MENEVDITRDMLSLLRIFPNEIWMIVWESLDDNDDREKFSNSSLFLRNMVSTKRTTFLFPKVWGIFGPRFEDLERAEYFANEPPGQEDYAVKVRKCDTCGKDIFRQPYTEVLKLRLVCYTWTNAIDTIHKCNPHQFDSDLDHDDIYSPLCWRQKEFNSIDGMEGNFLEFYRHFEGTHAPSGTGRSPFFARAISIIHGRLDYDGPADSGRQLYNEMPNFLLKYGQHVLYCYIQIRFEAPIVETYERLNIWLTRMPNLKTLELNILEMGDGTNNRDFLPSPQERAAFREAINSNPFPVLKRLDFIKIRSCPKMIFRNLIEQNNHVSKLKIFPNNAGSSFHFYDAPSVKLPVINLKEFATTVYSEPDFLQLADPLKNCRLSKLHLEIDLGEDGYMEWRSVFKMLRPCNETLTELVLRLPQEYPNSHPECAAWLWRLRLRNVTRLKLSLPNYSSLDFILPMKKSLRYLDVVVDKEDCCDDESKTQVMKLVDENQVVKFFSRIKRPRKSNMWKLFPKFRRIAYYEAIRQPDGEEVKWKEELIWSRQREE